VRIFGPKRDREKLKKGRKKLHNEELHNLYSLSNIIRLLKSWRMRWIRHVGRVGEIRNAFRILFGNPDGERPLDRSRRKREDDIKMDLK